MDPNKPQQVLPNYQSNDPNIPSYNPNGYTIENDPNAPVIKGGNMNPNMGGKEEKEQLTATKKAEIKQKTKKEPKTPKEKIFDAKKIAGVVIGGVIGVIVLAIGIVFIIQALTNNKPAVNPDGPDNPGSGEVGKPEEISLQLALNEWLTEQPASNDSGVLVYDIDHDSIVARHNEDNAMWIGNLYQMFIAYEGYYRLNHEALEGSATLPIGNDFEGKPYTISHCLDYMIKFSYLPCSEILANMFGWDNLQASFNEQGFKNTNIHGLTSNASDLLKLYQMYWKHNDFDEKTWNIIQDSLFAQTAATQDPVYAQNWRKGLPSGFSTAMVYNKTGFYSNDGKDMTDSTKLYGAWNDAAFVVFPEVENKDGVIKPERHYIIIVTTKNTKPQEVVKLGRKFEDAVKSADNYGK